MDCYKYTRTIISGSGSRPKIMAPVRCLLIFLVSTILVESFTHANLITPVEVEGHKFPPMLKLQNESDKIFFLGGAGVRGMVIHTGQYVKFTSIAVYMEITAIKSLAPKWKGKSGEELNKTEEFFRDIITGPFEKFTQVRMIEPLSGKNYSGKVAENCIHAWEALQIYTTDDTHAIQAFLQVFQSEKFPPGSSIYFTQKPSGSLKIGFSHGDGKVKTSVINNKKLSEAILMSIIGQGGVSPAARQSLADRLSELLKKQA